MTKNIIILAIWTVALCVHSFELNDIFNKRNTFYFINENNDIDTTICKIDNNFACLAGNEYVITKTMDKVYTAIDKDDNEFTIITNDEYHTPEWADYKIRSCNNNRAITVTFIILLEILVIIVYVHEIFMYYSNKSKVVNKYGTEE